MNEVLTTVVFATPVLVVVLIVLWVRDARR